MVVGHWEWARATRLRLVHLVSAWAEPVTGNAQQRWWGDRGEGSTQRLLLAQEAAEAKDNDCAAIPAILNRLPIKGALVTIDAMAFTPAVATAITAKGGDDILALNRN